MTDFNGAAIPAGVPERFDHPFDYVHKISINPTNGDVYVACHRRIVRSTNEGATFQTVFGSAVSGFAAGGQGDVVISPTGIVYIAVTGAASDLTLRGIWKSATGNFNSYTRLAGGSVLGVDSVDGWRGNSYTFVPPSTTFYQTRRTLLALAPSNENILYVLYENGLSVENSNKEADLFKLDMTSGNNWTNLSNNLPDFPGGNHVATDPFAIQGGYDLFITVKPNDPNFVLLGGTSLYRSTNGFATTAATSWIGGYGNTLPTLSFYGQTNNPSDPSKWSHPDIHIAVFNPSNVNEVICGNDGGMQKTSNITATGGTEPVAWNIIRNYQTLQYYHVAIDPVAGKNNFIGGAQDNGTHIRLEGGGTPNDQFRILGGDGGAAGIGSITSGSVFTVYGSLQFGELYRDKNNDFVKIKPNGLTPFPGLTDAFGEFVTYMKLDFDNPEDLYYVNFNRLFRTRSASTVTSSSGWQELNGVGSAVNPGNPTTGTGIAIRSMELSRGPYVPTHVLYMGTSDGKIFRLDDPRNAPATATPVNISPVGMQGSVSDIAVNPNNDQEVMAVISNYTANNQQISNVWWTDNAKDASPVWRQLDGNLGLPSIRSCMIVVKRDGLNNSITEYYVGTSVGLYSTLDIKSGSVNWVREGGNVLNYAIITSMDYRPQDNTLLIGTHGNGLYYAAIGNADFRPNLGPGVDSTEVFIRQALPTIVDQTINYQIGNMFTTKKLSVNIYNMGGQLMYSRQGGYVSGRISVPGLARGVYVLTITGDDRGQRFVQRFFKR